MNHILNAFSFNMVEVPHTHPMTISAVALTVEEAMEYIDSNQPMSGVGHADTAAVFAATLKRDVPSVRATIKLNPGDSALIGQYSGPRLPEGATALPEGASIKWILVTI